MIQAFDPNRDERSVRFGSIQGRFVQRYAAQYAELTQSGSKNWRAAAIPRTIPIDSTRDV